MTQATFQFLSDHPVILGAAKVVIVFTVLSGAIAFLVYVERKVLAFMQARLGPMRVGPWGLLQALADPIKLLLKEDIVPAEADKALFLIAPVIGVIAAFTAFSVIPFTEHFVISDLNIGILFALAVSSLGIYGIILGGWASNSHYPLLGALRSSAPPFARRPGGAPPPAPPGLFCWPPRPCPRSGGWGFPSGGWGGGPGWGAKGPPGRPPPRAGCSWPPRRCPCSIRPGGF